MPGKLTQSLDSFKARWCRLSVLLPALLFLVACGDGAWNNPYKPGVTGESIFFSSFSERPKHLDPARSYASNEWAFISQIYEPPLQYHYLRRPYQVVPLTATAMPEIRYFNAAGEAVSGDLTSEIAYTDYVLRIQPGIRFQPHPAFARKPDGSYAYWPLPPDALDGVNALGDFAQTGTRELTAADYLYQIKRLAFAANHSPVASLMAEHIRGFSEFAAKSRAARQALGKVDGFTPWLDLRTISMSGLELIDRYSYRIRVEKKYPQFVFWLAMNFFAPMPWEAERFYRQPGMSDRNLNLHWYPVGTGPFMLTENNPNLRMALSRNPNFHGEAYPRDGDAEDVEKGLLADAGKPMPFIDKAVYSLEKEAIPRWNKFLQGFYDNSGIGSDSFDQAVQFGSGGEATLTEAMRERGIRLSTAVETSVFYTGFNMLDPVVGGDSERARKLRQAIAIAVDYEEFISIFRNGRGEAAQGPLPPGIFGHRGGEAGINTVTHRWRNGAPRRRDIEDAKALLDEAGYVEGRDPQTGGPLILYYDTPDAGPDRKARLQWYRKQLAKLDIQLVIRPTDYNRFQDKMLKGTAQIFSWGWNADYPDPENFLFLLYGPNGKVEAKGENAANFEHAEFDALFLKMKDMPNGPARQQVIDRMVGILRRESPWLFGFFPKAFSLHHAWYENAKPHLMANNTLKYKRVNGPQRAESQQAWNRPVLWPVWLLLIGLVLSLLPAVRSFRQRERSRAL